MLYLKQYPYPYSTSRRRTGEVSAACMMYAPTFSIKGARGTGGIGGGGGVGGGTGSGSGSGHVVVVAEVAAAAVAVAAAEVLQCKYPLMGGLWITGPVGTLPGAHCRNAQPPPPQFIALQPGSALHIVSHCTNVPTWFPTFGQS